MLPALHAIIPAGGAGTRLWPLSRQGKPKFLLDLAGTGRSLLQETFDRLKPLSLTITVVTGAAHYDEVCRQLPELSGGDDPFPGEIIVEPSPRDSMAAIGIATYAIRERYGDSAVVGSFAADHLIASGPAFAAAVAAGVAGARLGYLTTVGITPDSPSTAFGYIEPGEVALAPSLFPVERFVEKPDAVTAEKYLSEGYLWNAGMFIAQAATIADALAQQLPTMDADLTQLARKQMASVIETGEAAPLDPALWERLTRIAIDYALAEPLAAAGKVAVVRAGAEMGWTDIGDFAAVAQLRPAVPENVIAIDSQVPLVLGSADSQQVVAVVGIDRAVVVQTPDALLVTTQDAAQQVKDVVDELKDSGRGKYV